MTPELPDDLRPLLDLARDYLRNHEEARRVVALAGRALSALAAWSDPPAAAPPAAPPPEPLPVSVAVAPASPAPPPKPPPPPLPPAVPIASLPPLTFAPPPAVAPHTAYGGTLGEVRPDPLAVIAARCRIKAEACLSVARRLTGSDERDTAADIIRRANLLTDCFIWPLDSRDTSDAPAVWKDLAAGFEAAAEAAEMLRLWGELPEPNHTRLASDALHLAAECQAVLYAAVAATGRPKPDGDQIHLFVTIREEASRLQVFVHRYLKREDRADPANAPDVARRVREFAAPLRKTAEAGKNRHKVVANLKFKAKRLKEDPAAHTGEWPRVAELLDELVAGGLPPSNAEVRDILLPLLDAVPEDLQLTPNAERVLREVDRYVASRPPAESRPVEEELSREVAEVRELLAGRQVVLIGGDVRPHRKEALIEAFGLDDLVWIATIDHQSVSIFEAPVSRPEVAVVLLAIRWSSHSYGDVQSFCERSGKLLVRLPGGYHPNQVAHQILTQVGHRLRSAG